MSEPRKPRSFKLDAEPSSSNKKNVGPKTVSRTKASTAVKRSEIPSSVKTNSKAPKQSASKDNQKSETTRKPKAVRQIEELTALPDEAAQVRSANIEDLEPLPMGPMAGTGWTLGKVFRWSLFALFSLGIGLWIDQLVRDLFERNTLLGWVGISITAVLVLAALALAVREIVSLSKMKSIQKLQEDAKKALENPEINSANAIKRQVTLLLQNRPRYKAVVEKLNADLADSVDGRDVLELTERHMLGPIDREATDLILSASKRVSVVTAVSPRAVVDIAYVLYENLRLISQLSSLYGGRTGTIGFYRLSKNVLMHLAATGALSVGDGLFQQIIGHGLSAKLSARLGEGVLNGLLTARIGISAMDICRPMPFQGLKRPGITDFLSKLGPTSA